MKRIHTQSFVSIFAIAALGASTALADSARTASVSGAGTTAAGGGIGGAGAGTRVAPAGNFHADPRSFGTSRDGAFVFDNGFEDSVINDPPVYTNLPTKSGVAVFTTNAGNFQIEFNYAGRFNGDFEDHTAGFRLRFLIPPF